METTLLEQTSTRSEAASHSAYVVPLASVSRLDTARVGVKAANLGELARTGFLVPDGLVLTTEAFERFLAKNALHSGSPPEAVTAAPLPFEVQQALREASASVGEGSLAVRSSGVAEDLPGASFAGQYETVLDVRGPDALMAAVRQCWASAFNGRSTAYRMAQGQTRLASMAVLVQRLV